MLSTTPTFMLIVFNVCPQRTNVRDILHSVVLRHFSPCAAFRNLVFAVSFPFRFYQTTFVVKSIHLQLPTVTLNVPIRSLQKKKMKRCVADESLEVLETE